MSIISKIKNLKYTSLILLASGSGADCSTKISDKQHSVLNKEKITRTVISTHLQTNVCSTVMAKMLTKGQGDFL